MPIDLQTGIALIIVALAVIGLVLRAVRGIKSPSGCGGCSGCPSNSGPPLIQLDALPPKPGPSKS